jgi:hypothetical protein
MGSKIRVWKIIYHFFQVDGTLECVVSGDNDVEARGVADTYCLPRWRIPGHPRDVMFTESILLLSDVETGEE